MKKVTLFLLLGLFYNVSFSQYNNIREADILYKKKIIRSVNLKNTVNEALFGIENRLAQVLLEAYEKGELNGYKTDALKEILRFEDYKAKMEVKMREDDTLFYTPAHLYQVEIGENLIFDKHRSEIIFDIESITLFIPEKINHRGLLEPVISFQYDDCVAIFKKDERAVAVNPLMNGRNVNYSEVFLLRLFGSDIVKIGNDNYFDQMYSDPTLAYVARKNAENQLTEYLYKLYHPR